MALRPPSRYAANALGGSFSGPSGASPIDYEIAGEKAAALGRAGARVERAVAVLAAADSAGRDAAMKDAADAVYAYFIQRELCGLRRHQDVIHEYAIPADVLARLGVS